MLSIPDGFCVTLSCSKTTWTQDTAKDWDEKSVRDQGADGVLRINKRDSKVAIMRHTLKR